MSTMLLYRDDRFNSNFFYFSGQDFDHSFLLVSGKEKTLLVPRLNERAARELFQGTVIAYTDPFKELSGMLRGKSIHVDGKALSMNAFMHLKKFCRPVDASEELYRMRSRKKREEIAKISRAVEITKEIFNTAGLKNASCEEEVRKLLLKETLERGLVPAFDPIVATGRNSAFPHHAPGKKKLEDVVLVDYGVRYEGYCADLTRCYFQERGSKSEQAYKKANGVFEEILDQLPHCRTGRDVALFAEKVMKKAGLPKMLHSTGHGIGLDVHEFPRISKKYKDRISGCVFALEPAAYFRDFGVRFEQVVHFSGKKARIL